MSFYANELIFASTAATEMLESLTDFTNSFAASMFLAISESFPEVNAIAPSANTSTDFSSTFTCPQLIATASVEFAFSITITPTVNEETKPEIVTILARHSTDNEIEFATTYPFYPRHLTQHHVEDSRDPATVFLINHLLNLDNE